MLAAPGFPEPSFADSAKIDFWAAQRKGANMMNAVQTEAQLAVSEAVLREVASHFPGMTLEQLVRRTTVTAKASTQLFEITVQDASPARAAVLANDIAHTLLKQQSALNAQAVVRQRYAIERLEGGLTIARSAGSVAPAYEGFGDWGRRPRARVGLEAAREPTGYGHLLRSRKPRHRPGSRMPGGGFIQS